MAMETEKGAPSLATSGHAHVDLFFKLNQDAHQNPLLESWLEAAWKESPLDTIIVLFHARDCRGGLGVRDTFVKCMVWCIVNHLEWFEVNLHNIPHYGRYLDWFDILVELKDVCNRRGDNFRYYVVETMVVKAVADQLEADLSSLSSGKSVSLLAKWMPSEGKSLERKLHILRPICARLFHMDNANVGSRELRRLRKMVLEPLRSHTDLVERKMCDGKWDEIDFETVPSVAMKRLRKAFEKQAGLLFKDWCVEVQQGKRVIKAGQLYPHELVRPYINGDVDEDDPVLEEQWKALQEKYGQVEDTLVLADVSGSMNGVPMEVSVALGIFLSTLGTGPFKNRLITFHQEPTFHTIPAHCVSLREKVESVRKMAWGGNTNFHKVYELILGCARETEMPAEEMPKRLLVLSDMQFDDARSIDDMQFDDARSIDDMQFDDARKGDGATSFENMRSKYAEAGYALPEIVFWNLRSNSTCDFVADSKTKGVTMVSGFSPSVLSKVLSGDDLSPESTLRQVLQDPRYARVLVP